MLTDAHDQDLRAYARWISPNDGEDAYHDAICDTLRRGHAATITNYGAFYRHATKQALYKIFRSQRADRRNIEIYLAGDLPPSWQGLAVGRLPKTQCRRGHPMTDDNLVYVGPRRTCKTCYDANQHRKAARRRLAKELGVPVVSERPQRNPRPVPTHCRRGHVLTEENVRNYGQGRLCRTCDVARHAQRWKETRTTALMEVAHA